MRDTGYDGEDAGNLFGAIDALRIPVDYLAELFTAGDPAPVDAVLRKLAAMRSYMRDINLGREPDESIPAAVGMTGEQMYDMYRLLAIAKYEERYVIPAAHAEQAHSLEELATECSLDYDGGPGMGGSGPFGEALRRPVADRGGELPHAQGAADRRHASSTRPTRRAGSTCSTGTARAPGRAVPASRRRHRPSTTRHRSSRDAAGREPLPTRAIAWQAASLLLGYPRLRTARRAALRRDAAGLDDRRRRTAAGGSSSTLRRDARCRARRPTTSRPSTTAGAAACT